LAPHAITFGDQLLLAGYPPERAVRHLQLLAQLSRWMEAQELTEEDLGEENLGEFLKDRRAAGYWGRPSVGWLAKLLGLIPGLELMPVPPAAPTASEALIERYCHHLRQERGLAVSTVRGYVAHARRFVSRFADDNGEIDVSGMTAKAVISFVVDQRRSRCLGSAAKAVTVVRSLLRFLSLEGLVPSGVAEAVPAVSVCKGFLPRALSPETVAALLGGCDISTVVGRRDYAVLSLMIRLGLRAGEVAGLTLDDLDWQHGEVVVRGKGSRQERLPLPVDVGQAVVAYLRGGRPDLDSRAVFIRMKAPIRSMTSSAVSQTVTSACKRAGLAPVGAHRLRHSAATTMLHAGVPLADVGQVLRQTALSTTAVYAKVDRVALRPLARPWPGARS
jgi:integrase/recombinase XerD